MNEEDNNSGLVDDQKSEQTESIKNDNDKIFDFFDEQVKKIESTSDNDVKFANIEQNEKFIAQKDYDPFSFNPNDSSNYERAVAKETIGSALAKGFDSFGTRFEDTFTEYWKSYGRMADALLHLDMKKLLPDEETMMKQNIEEHENEMKNFVFVEEGTEDDIFSKKALSSAIGNTGFALGTLTGVTVELLSDALITIATGGSGGLSFAGTLGRLGTKLGLKSLVKESAEVGAKTAAKKATSFIDDLLKGFNTDINAIKTTKEMSAKKMAGQAKNLANIFSKKDYIKSSMKEFGRVLSFNLKDIYHSKTFTEAMLNTAKGIPVVGTGVKYAEKIAEASAKGYNTASLIGMGFQGIKRMGTEFNMASTEAAFEAVSSYGTTLDKMINDKEKKTGRPITYNDIIEMKDMALKSSLSNYNTNLAILLATDKIEFGNMFRRFTPTNKMMQEMLQVSGGAEDVLNVRRLWKSSVTASKVYRKTGLLGTYGLIGKIAKDFGKKQAVYEAGKQFLSGVKRFSLVEGLQENMQEMSSSAWTDYYVAKYNGIEHSITNSFDKGLGEQFSKRGLNTFLQGAFTGILIAGPSKAISSIPVNVNKVTINKQYKGDDKNNPLKQAEKLKEENISTVNKFLSLLQNGTAEEKEAAFGLGLDAAMEQSEAALEGDLYKFKNANDNGLLTAAIAAEKTGSIDLLVNQLITMGAEMTNEDFKSSFGFDVAETKYQTPQGFVKDLSSKIKKYSDEVIKIRKDVHNHLEDPFIYEKGSSDRIISFGIRAAQEEFITMTAMNRIKASRASERAKSIVNEYNSNEELANSSDYVFRVMTDKDAVEAEIGTLLADIKELESSLKTDGLSSTEEKEIKKSIKDKKKEVLLLDRWSSFFRSRADISGNESDKGYVFVGELLKEKATEVNEKGEKIGEKEDLYKTNSKNVRNTFVKLLNIKNKQSNINSNIDSVKTVDGFVLVDDFMKLDQDAKDYMSAVDAMYSPEKYRKMTKNIREGRFKAAIVNAIEYLDDRIDDYTIALLIDSGIAKINEKGYLEEVPNHGKNISIRGRDVMRLRSEFKEKFRNSKEYKDLLNIVYDSDFSKESLERVQDLIENLDNQKNSFKKELANELGIDLKEEKSEPKEEEKSKPKEEEKSKPKEEEKSKPKEEEKSKPKEEEKSKPKAKEEPKTKETEPKGKKAEPKQFSKDEFTDDELMKRNADYIIKRMIEAGTPVALLPSIRREAEAKIGHDLFENHEKTITKIISKITNPEKASEKKTPKKEKDNTEGKKITKKSNQNSTINKAESFSEIENIAKKSNNVSVVDEKDDNLAALEAINDIINKTDKTC